MFRQYLVSSVSPFFFVELVLSVLKLFALMFIEVTIRHHLSLFVLQLVSLFVDLSLFCGCYTSAWLTITSAIPVVVPVLGSPVVVVIPIIFGNPAAVIPVTVAPVVCVR